MNLINMEPRHSGVSSLLCRLYEPPHDNTNKMTCVPREDRSALPSTQSDQSLLSA